MLRWRNRQHAQVSGTCPGNGVGVRFPPLVLTKRSEVVVEVWAKIVRWAEMMQIILKGTEDFEVRIDGQNNRILFVDHDFENAIPLHCVTPGCPGVSAIITSDAIWVRDADVAQ